MSELKSHRPTHDFLICIDSDGCAFDSMEIKHKECFIPNIIQYWKLQAISKYARQAAEFVNLYSKHRGINRFQALTMTFDLLGEWDVVKRRGVSVPAVPSLRRWIQEESRLGNPALEAYCKSHDDTEMHQALAWSKAVNRSVEEMVEGVPPFPYVRESLAKAAAKADLLVCSATPQEALIREWKEHGIDKHVFAIAGQEQGSKKEHIAAAGKGKYDPSRILMIGDAPGDMSAARANGACFFPIVPNREEESWERFHGEAMGRFFDGQYAGAYEAGLVAEFEASLPDTPPWK